MAITIDDFSKIWASTSPLTPYEFSEDNYKQGWNFVGSTPPSRQMWDFLQKQNDEKLKYLLDNFSDYLPLSGGTMTGTLTLADGGTALSNATVGTVLTDSMSETTALPSQTGVALASVDCTAGTWVVTGHVRFSTVTSGKVYSCGLSTASGGVNYASDGTTCFQASSSTASPLQVVRIFTSGSNATVYLNAYSNEASSVNAAEISAVRIV